MFNKSRFLVRASWDAVSSFKGYVQDLKSSLKNRRNLLSLNVAHNVNVNYLTPWKSQAIYAMRKDSTYLTDNTVCFRYK